MAKEKTERYQAKEFIEKYIKNKGIKQICDLFSKETLIEFVNQIDWDWSIEDEMQENNCTEDEARRKTEEWFMSMKKAELWDRINTFNQADLILDKAYDLGFVS